MKPLRIFVGWDWRDAEAFKVFQRSLVRHASIPVDVTPIVDRDLRQRGLYWRSYRVEGSGQMIDDRDGKPFSTQFSFTRFAVPLMTDYADEWVIYADPDMLWRTDIAKLMEKVDRSKAVSCVQHNHLPKEQRKIDGVLQTTYRRKNWSSLMVMNPAKCHGLTKYDLNNATGEYLHALCWISDDEIGALPESWNWLCGYSSPGIVPDLVHYTLGTPDIPGHENDPYAGEWRGYLNQARKAA